MFAFFQRPPPRVTESTPHTLYGDEAVQHFAAQRDAYYESELYGELAATWSDFCANRRADAVRRHFRLLERRESSMPLSNSPPTCLFPSVEESTLQGPDGRAMAVRYSPDGMHVALGHQKGVFICTSASVHTADPGMPVQLSACDTGHDLGWALLDVAWHESSLFVVRCGWSTNLALLKVKQDDAPALSVRQRMSEVVLFDAAPLSSQPFCVFSVDMLGDVVVAGTNVNLVFAADVTTKQTVHVSKHHLADVNAVCAVGPHTFASGGDDGVVLITDMRQSRVAFGFGHTHGLTGLSARGDGRHVASNSKDQTAKIWDLRNAVQEQTTVRAALRDTQESLQGQDYRGGPAWSANVPPSATRSDGAELTLRGHKVFYTLLRCRFSPFDSTGGRFLAVGSIAGPPQVYDLTTGNLSSFNPSITESLCRDLAWHPDGSRLTFSTAEGQFVVLGPEPHVVHSDGKPPAPRVLPNVFANSDDEDTYEDDDEYEWGTDEDEEGVTVDSDSD